MSRYCDILPYDRTRVLLGSGSDYVNASLVQEPQLTKGKRKRWWIASQAPTPDTVPAFWRLATEPSTSRARGESEEPLPPANLIVQLTPLVEGGRRKCEPYFPPDSGVQSRVGRTIIKLVSKEERPDRRVSQLELEEDDGKTRRVIHVEYLGWRDHGVPSDTDGAIQFVREMVELNDSIDATAPVLLHCSAGVGRTGTVITLASLLPLIDSRATTFNNETSPLGPLQNADPVASVIDALRDQRCTMVQTAQQEAWCYQATASAWSRSGS